MPWRKYHEQNKVEDGKYGPTYLVGRGVRVRQKADGKWILNINKGLRRKNKTFGEGRDGLVLAIKTGEKLAAKFELYVPVKQDKVDDSNAPHFIPYSKQWFEVKSRGVLESTAQRYEEILRLHIWPNNLFQEKRVDEIRRKDVRVFLKRVYMHRSARTVEIVHSVLSNIFGELVDDEYIMANPASNILKSLLPKKSKRNINDAEPFNEDERDRFLAQAKNPRQYCMLLRMMAFAGLRLGEALAMRETNINFEDKTYHVQESFKRKKYGWPKGKKKRFVDLPQFLVDELSDYIRNLKKDNLNQGRKALIDHLFLDPKEKYLFPFSQGKIQRLVEKVSRLAELERRNPHDLRHTYATLLLIKNVSPAYVQKQLGHSSIRTTIDIYGHWIQGEGKDKLEEVLGSSCTKSGRKVHISAYISGDEKKRIVTR